jgi:pre-mRNA-splicing helicase BRR2
MLSAPRRSPGIPSPDGKLALYTQSTYSFESHSKTNEIHVIDITTADEVTLTKDAKASEPRWLGHGYDIVWLREGDNGNTSFIVSDATQPGKTYVAGTVAGPVSNLKVHVIEPGTVAIAVSGQADKEGALYNPKDEQKTNSSARIYDGLFVRHWDHYVTNQRNTIFTALLQKAQPRVTGRQGRYTLLGFTNALSGNTKLECPIPPFGGTDHFDISSRGIAFVAKDPDLNPATHTKCDLWFVRRSDPMDMTFEEPIRIAVPGIDGAASSPSFSPDGRSIAFLKMATDGYESDKNRIILVHGLPGNIVDADQAMEVQAQAAELLSTTDGKGAWDRSPSAVSWTIDGTSLLLQAEDIGEGCLFVLDLSNPPEPGWRPRKITAGGTITEVAPLATNSPLLFVSGNSLVDNSMYMIVDPTVGDEPASIRMASSSSQDGTLFGLSPAQVSSLWWKGADDHDVHAIMMKPSFFKTDQKYPLAYLIHGGPQGAWNNSWSTRWNPAIFAEQGYIVVCPNPTGSTGYGQDFTDAIRNHWGGRPYEDLVKGMEHIEKNLDFVDMDKCVALGASYGGYMMNWFQGHDIAKKFKALVCHDGVFSMTAQLASDEQYFPVHDLGGPIWERQEVYDEWDPSRFLKNWNTPMLVIHNELDYRLTIAEGLSAFNVLQMRGIKSRFLSFPDENHWVLKQENSLVWHLQVLNWINSFVGLPKVADREGRDGSEYLKAGHGTRL